MKKILLLILVFFSLLFFSCAGSGSSASEDDIGYLSFGSPRAAGLAAFGITSANLTDLTLKGTKDGNTKTLGTWASGSEVAGTRIAIQAGTWTFELSAKNNGDSFTAAKTVEIKAGQHNDVAFTMSFAGRPLNDAQTGDIIMSDGTSRFVIPYNIYSQCSELTNTATVESIALRDGSTIYGIYPDKISGSYNHSDTSALIANLPGGWRMPTETEANSVISNRTTIDNGISASGNNQYISDLGDMDSQTQHGFWTSTPWTQNPSMYSVCRMRYATLVDDPTSLHCVLPVKTY